MKSCFPFQEFVVDTSVMDKICKYHKRKGQEYRANDCVKDFCSDAFYVAYPYCLALLYDAHRAEFAGGKLCLSCPHPGGITFEVERVHAHTFPVRIAKKIFEWIVAKILYPLDWEDWQIRLTVTQSHGQCPAQFKEGQKYWFNIRRVQELCPASFHGIYPLLLSSMSEGGQEGESVIVHCPDHEGMTYTIRKR